MNFLKLAQKNKESHPEAWEQFYSSLVVKKIRKKYSTDQELAILRKELAILHQRNAKTLEFDEYNEYVEECKSKAKAEMNDDI